VVSKRDELFGALSARLLSFTALYDVDAVLAPEAASLARALMAAVPDPSRDREAVLAIAEFYNLRALLLGQDDDGPDAVIAAALARMAGIGSAGIGSAATDAPGAAPAGQGTRASLREVAEAAREAGALLAAGGDPRALAGAALALRAALDAVPADLLAFRGRPLAILGAVLFELYERTGRLPDLHDAIRAFRAATAATRPGSDEVVSQLGVALRARYERAGALDDLNESVARARQVAATTPAGDVNHAGRLHNLGIALRLRYERTGSHEDLDEAIRVYREAVSATGPGHPGYVMVRSGLRNALLVRADRGGEAAEYAEIMALDEQALRAAPPGELRVKALGNLAATLTRRYETEGGAGDADRAVALLREARAIVPDGHSLTMATHYQLALVHWARYGRLEDQRDLDAAVSCMRTAAGQPAGPPGTRLWAAIAWGRWALAAGDARQALAGYEQAIELLPVIAPRNLARGDAEHALSQRSGLASDAAAAAIAAGAPERAVVLLEQGRGILLAQDLEARDDVAELRDHAPDVAARFLELRAALSTVAEVSLDLAGPGETAGDLRHVLAADWDRLLAEIRALPGFTNFLRPPPFGRLLEQAAHGPVVLVNVSRHRCDALVLTSGGLRVVPLPGLTLDDALRRTVAFLTVLEQPGGRDDASEAELSAGLAWLWDTVAGPVLDALGLTPHAPGAGWPRVWWIPTGPLAFLPLHAAGYHGTAEGRSVLDRVVSSYAPTLRTLAHARRPARRVGQQATSWSPFPTRRVPGGCAALPRRQANWPRCCRGRGCCETPGPPKKPSSRVSGSTPGCTSAGTAARTRGARPAAS
jgi:tetratricopeptide (TPR) repeat protein